jgi:protein-tyrosine phosphatase
MLDDGRARIAAVMTALARAERAVLFHCYGGRDRTGMVAAMLLRLAGVPDDEIVRDYVVTDERMEPLYEQWRTEMEEARRARFDGAIAEASAPIEAALHHFDERYGGVEPYLRAGGVTDDDVARLHEALVA